MTDERVTAHVFHQADGVEDWRILYGGAYAHFTTGSFAEAARLVQGIAEAAEEVGHYPDIDLRPDGVTVRTFSLPFGQLTNLDIPLARTVSRVAAEMGVSSDPSRLTMLSLAVAHDPDTPVSAFWAAALGYEEVEDDAVDPTRRNPGAAFHPFRDSRPGRGRLHIDVSVPVDQFEQRVQAAVAAGGEIVQDRSNPPLWFTLRSPDNHGVDIACWPDIENFGDEG